MRNTFATFTIGLILLGFVFPLAWIGAFITGVLAMFSSPPGLREDGKPKTGGLIGPLWDGIVIGYTMKECPYCLSKIKDEAQKCPHCGEWVNSEGKQIPCSK